ncbi:MAG: alpha/beta hydrolase [Alphaproteobacteria bacterium]
MRIPGADYARVEVDGLGLNVATMGAGPPLLLLHGYPQTHLIWRKVAPELAQRFTLVMPDLPGYGASEGPEPDGGQANYAKREIAGRLVALMRRLGHERFHVCGHDRGGRVAYRMALDMADAVDRLVLLDIIPTGEQFARMQAKGAMRGFHWLFLAQPAPLPEQVIGADPEAFVGGLLDRWAGHREALADARAAYVEQYDNPNVVQASCEDYRAGWHTDRVRDEEDRAAGRKIAAKTLVLWATRYLADPEPVWREWCEDVTVQSLDCGHFLAEEKSDDVAAAMVGFLK